MLGVRSANYGIMYVQYLYSTYMYCIYKNCHYVGSPDGFEEQEKKSVTKCNSVYDYEF